METIADSQPIQHFTSDVLPSKNQAVICVLSVPLLLWECTQWHHKEVTWISSHLYYSDGTSKTLSLRVN